MSQYQSPTSDLIPEAQEKRLVLGKVLSYFSLLSFIVLFGLMSFFSNMVGVFNQIKTGLNDPQLIAGEISQSLVPVLLTNILSLPSILGIFLVLFISSYRSKYFYWFWVFIALALLISIPIGTVLGFILLIVLFVKKSEFQNA